MNMHPTLLHRPMLDESVTARLRAVALRLRGYVLLEGVAWVIGFLFAAAVIQFTLDYGTRGLQWSMRAALLAVILGSPLDSVATDHLPAARTGRTCGDGEPDRAALPGAFVAARIRRAVLAGGRRLGGDELPGPGGIRGVVGRSPGAQPRFQHRARSAPLTTSGVRRRRSTGGDTRHHLGDAGGYATLVRPQRASSRR